MRRVWASAGGRVLRQVLLLVVLVGRMTGSRRVQPSLKARKLLTRLLNAHQKVAEIDGPTATDGPVFEKQTLAWALEYATARHALDRYLVRLEAVANPNRIVAHASR